MNVRLSTLIQHGGSSDQDKAVFAVQTNDSHQVDHNRDRRNDDSNGKAAIHPNVNGVLEGECSRRVEVGNIECGDEVRLQQPAEESASGQVDDKGDR